MTEFKVADDLEQAFREGLKIGFKQGWESHTRRQAEAKKGQTITIKGKLPSLNEYIAACRTNPHVGAKMKQETEQLIIIQLAKLKPITSPAIIHFTWHEKTRRRDKDNVAAGKKFILDAMQKAGKLINDNNKYIAGFTDRFTYGSDYGVTITVEAVETLQDAGQWADNPANFELSEA